MKAACSVLVLVLVLTGFSGITSAQQVISAKAGLINYTEGKVLLEGKEISFKNNAFPQMKAGEQMQTSDSRAELLLNPGVFLRMGENSGLKLVSDKLEDTRVELVAGSIVVECDWLDKADRVTLLYKNATIAVVKNGLYRLDSEPAQLRVYEGEVEVEQGGQIAKIGKGRLLPLNGLMVAEKFDVKTGDALFRWARRRAEYVAMANPSAARGLGSSATSWFAGGWIFNPYFGWYTFVPGRGMCNSFWGYSYWSPASVWNYYNQPNYNYSGPSVNSYRADSNYGYSGSNASYTGTSGAAVSSPAPSAAPSSAVSAVSHSSGSAGGAHK